MSWFVCVIVVLKLIIMIPSFAITRELFALFNVFMHRCETVVCFVLFEELETHSHDTQFCNHQRACYFV